MIRSKMVMQMLKRMQKWNQYKISLLAFLLVPCIFVSTLLLSGCTTTNKTNVTTATKVETATDHAYLAKDNFVTLKGERSNLAQAVQDLVADADAYMAQLKVSSADQKAVEEDIREQLYKLQDETEKRILGDHGVLHVYTNWQKAKHYLATRPEATPEICFATLIAQVYHDTGYSVYPCNIPITQAEHNTDKHDLFSGVIQENDNTFPVYKKILSAKVCQEMLYAVRTHNAQDSKTVLTNTGVDSNIIALTVNLSDKCALSIRDKLPSIFDNSPKLLQLVLDNYGKFAAKRGQRYNKEFVTKFSAALQATALPQEQKERYQTLQSQELEVRRCQKTAQMLFCYLPEDCLKYNSTTKQNEILVYRVSYGFKGEAKLQRTVITKLFEDLQPRGKEETKQQYNAKIRSLYAAACQPGGVVLDNTRGLHITVQEIAVGDIPGSQYDYQLYNLSALAGK